MSTPENSPATGADFIRQFLPNSPYVGHLGMRLVEMQPDSATLALPFSATLITIGTVVHGGAIASLIDTTAMVAAWSGAALPEKLRGTTVGMTVNYLTAASSEDLQATASVLQRGKNLVYLDVEVRGASGKLVAKGLVTYKIG
ncbi:MAG TPA: PaaI family thioesterase [Ktedonobacterales bacterium]